MATTQVARTEQLPNPGIVDTETSRRFLDVDLHPVHLLSTTIPEPVEFTKVVRSQPEVFAGAEFKGVDGADVAVEQD